MFDIKNCLIKEMPDGSQLVIRNNIPYYVKAHSSRKDYQIIFIHTPVSGYESLGVAESFEKALAYIQTLNSDHLLAVA
jgi:hypothetical protein